MGDVPGSLTVFGAPPSPVTVTVIRQSLGRRVLRALLALGACWGVAAVAVFIPLAHFLLVPAFLVAGPALALLRLREGERLASVRGRCPRCRVEQDFKPGGAFGRRGTIDCPNCLNTLRLSLGPRDGSRVP